MTRFLAISFLLGTLVACGGKKKDTEKLAGLCVDATKLLGETAGTGSTEDFQSILSSALQACSQACDGGDSPSCKTLDGHVHKVCHAMKSFCPQMCDSAESPSLKETTCRVAKEP